MHGGKKESKDKKKVKKVDRSQIDTSLETAREEKDTPSFSRVCLLYFLSFFLASFFLLLLSWCCPRRIKELFFLISCLESIFLSPFSSSSFLLSLTPGWQEGDYDNRQSLSLPLLLLSLLLYARNLFFFIITFFVLLLCLLMQVFLAGR